MLGLHDKDNLEKAERYDFVNVYLNPEFMSYSHHDGNDIAILEVNRPIIFSRTILPICLPSTDSENYSRVKGTVAGWGRMWADGSNSRYLQDTKVIVQTNEKCLKSKIGKLYDPEGMLCAYAKNADACQVFSTKRGIICSNF